MGLLEGEHVRRALELVFRAMVERTLWSRGQVPTAQVTGGIPVGTVRHDPRSPGHVLVLGDAQRLVDDDR
jgi:hypothetical protein